VFLPFVLKNALEQISGDANVERPAAARHDVREVAALVHGLIDDQVPELTVMMATTDPSSLRSSE
jgi:hypothetical protein